MLEDFDLIVKKNPILVSSKTELTFILNHSQIIHKHRSRMERTRNCLRIQNTMFSKKHQEIHEHNVAQSTASKMFANKGINSERIEPFRNETNYANANANANSGTCQHRCAAEPSQQHQCPELIQSLALQLSTGEDRSARVILVKFISNKIRKGENLQTICVFVE